MHSDVISHKGQDVTKAVNKENIFQYYIRKTRRTFQKRWFEHRNETGINHKVRMLNVSNDVWALCPHILLDFACIPAKFQMVSLLGVFKVIMTAVPLS